MEPGKLTVSRDRTIVVALIGVVGAVIAAVVGAPRANTPRPPVASPEQVLVPTVFDGRVVLEPQTGADLEGGEKSGQIRGSYSGGISEPVDLYLDSFGGLMTVSGGVYLYQGCGHDCGSPA